MSCKTEARIQQECFMWLWNEHPDTRGRFFRIVNESTNRITGARNKATGVIPGVADMCFLWRYDAHFIEFKAEKGVLSASQKNWKQNIERGGFKYWVVRSLEEFKNLISCLIE